MRGAFGLIMEAKRIVGRFLLAVSGEERTAESVPGSMARAKTCSVADIDSSAERCIEEATDPIGSSCIADSSEGWAAVGGSDSPKGTGTNPKEFD
jgi:hypothetical protein